MKLSNFVRCSDDVKLIDFGNAIIINNNNYAIKYEQVGSPNYVCPEALININNTRNCDKDKHNISSYKVKRWFSKWILQNVFSISVFIGIS